MKKSHELTDLDKLEEGEELTTYSEATQILNEKEHGMNKIEKVEYTTEGLIQAIKAGNSFAFHRILQNPRDTINKNAAAVYALENEKTEMLSYIESYLTVKQLEEIGMKAVHENKKDLIVTVIKGLLENIYRIYYSSGNIVNAEDYDDREKCATAILAKLLELEKIEIADAVCSKLVNINTVKIPMPHQYQDKPRLRAVLSFVLKELVEKGIYEQFNWIDQKIKLTVLVPIIEGNNTQRIHVVAIANNTHNDAERCLQTLNKLLTLGCHPYNKAEVPKLEKAFQNQFPNAIEQLKQLHDVIDAVPKPKSTVEELKEAVSNFFGFGKSSS